jgi:hypothetical protein
MAKQRKPLSESPNVGNELTPDALQFLKPTQGAIAAVVLTPQVEETPSEDIQPAEPKTRTERKKQPEKKGIMAKLMEQTEKEATVRLTVDLAESVHRKLSILSAKSGKKKAEIIRMLLDEALEDLDE